jgi:16S rRNA (uracil1498-N3)-methyltransferase
MRLSVGDELLLFNGRMGSGARGWPRPSKRGCVLEAQAQVRPQTLGPDLDLVVALVKRARLETIVEKAAELGARRVRLAITRRTQADHTKVPRLQAIAAEAAEQTGRLDVPEVLEPVALDRLLDGWDPARRLAFCDEGGAAPALDASGPPPGPWAVLIGPEGGSTRRSASGSALPFVTPVAGPAHPARRHRGHQRAHPLARRRWATGEAATARRLLPGNRCGSKMPRGGDSVHG